MRIISVKTLREFWRKHPQAEEPLKAWVDDTKRANWKSPNDIKERRANASILGQNRVIFNIKGNDYRLVVAVHYRRDKVYVRFVGTHADYDRINAETI